MPLRRYSSNDYSHPPRRKTDLLLRRLYLLHEAVAPEEIERRIAAHNEFGEYDEVTRRPTSAFDIGKDFLQVVVDCTDDGVDLGKCQAHGEII